MYTHEREALKCITQILRERLSDRIVHVFAFGSRVRGDYDEWSDFDVLVVVREKTPEIESEIISIIVDEETRMGLSFSPVIKDVKAFEREKSLDTPFYENIVKEGVKL
jgi:predicted nucleotidyltransferase